jgi:hypothetical protein
MTASSPAARCDVALQPGDLQIGRERERENGREREIENGRERTMKEGKNLLRESRVILCGEST